jgi:hypothetical protein
MSSEQHGYRVHPKIGAALARRIKTKDAFKLYLYFLDKVSKNNFINGTYEDFSIETGIHKGNISRVMKELISLNIIKKIRPSSYLLNPDISYEGGEKMYYVVKYKWDGEI